MPDLELVLREIRAYQAENFMMEAALEKKSLESLANPDADKGIHSVCDNSHCVCRCNIVCAHYYLFRVYQL